jgi:predicted Zn-dependent protease
MKFKLILAFFVIQFVAAQQRSCGMQSHMDKMLSNPEFKKRNDERQAKFEVEYQRLLNIPASSNRVLNPNTTIVIPVAVHFPSVPNSSNAAKKACFRAFAQTQIDVINADYNATNADISNWTSASAFYPGVNTGSIAVQFVIATQNHPAVSGITNGTAAVTFGTDFLGGADNDATWSGYMNFVVRDEGQSILGYSPLGGSPTAGDTVVMNTFCYGTGSGCTGYVPAAPFNLGRTVTHELGHFFNLDHTFASNSCTGNPSCATEGDRVCDTPRLTTETYNCPVAGSVNACGTLKSLTMNYMDYVDDACMYMFTAGQGTRALAYMNTIVNEFKPNVLGNTNFLASNFSIYPNPSNGNFTIELKEAAINYKVTVVDALGREVYNNDFNQSSDLVQNIQMKNAVSGIYFVNIQNNGATVTKKILVE